MTASATSHVPADGLRDETATDAETDDCGYAACQLASERGGEPVVIAAPVTVRTPGPAAMRALEADVL
jgi:hypothetical protein